MLLLNRRGLAFPARVATPPDAGQGRRTHQSPSSRAPTEPVTENSSEKVLLKQRRGQNSEKDLLREKSCPDPSLLVIKAFIHGSCSISGGVRISQWLKSIKDVHLKEFIFLTLGSSGANPPAGGREYRTDARASGARGRARAGAQRGRARTNPQGAHPAARF